jgi:protein SEY1
LSNVLIINVWTQDIGRFSASNLEIIKIIFEINLRFFNQESAKQLLFVIRDFKDSENLEYIQKIITEDVTRLWKEIKKPKQFENVNPEDFFHLRFFPLSHYVFEKPKFEAETFQLAKRLRDSTDPQFVFSQVDITKNIPFDGLFMFAEKIWETIKENKELNLPSQKIIVSNFRCGEVRKEAMELAQSDVERLQVSVSQNVHPHLRKELESVLSKSLRHFRENTDQYDEEIVREAEAQLIQDSQLRFANVSAIQKDKIESACVKWLREKVSDAKQILDFAQLLATMRAAKKEAVERYSAELHEGTIDDQASIDKLASRFAGKAESIVLEYITTKVNLLLKNLQNQKLKVLEAKMSSIFSDLKPTFWNDFLELFRHTFDNYSEEILSLRNNAKELKSAVDEQLFDSMKLDLYLTVRTSLMSRIRSLSSMIVEKFRRDFENDAAGMRRNWVAIEEAEINSLFKDAKKESMAVLDRSSDLVMPGMLTGRRD